MKKPFFFCFTSVLIAGLILFTLHSRGIAQSGEPSDSTLANAIALLNDSHPDTARVLFSTIPSTDAAYAQAQCYIAICLYNMTNYPAFLTQLAGSDMNNATVSPDLKRTLKFDNIDVLFKTRKFDPLFLQIEAFQQSYADSPQILAMHEYKMAALFEVGLKQAQVAATTNNETQSQLIWSKARLNLNEFLSMAPSQGDTYNHLTKRVLKENIWAARIALGEDEAAFAEIPAQDIIAQEKFCLLRIRILTEKLYRQRVDQNIQLMTNYLATFPPSDNAKRVEFNLAQNMFRKGEQLCKAADAAEQGNNMELAQSKRAVASQCFQQMRVLQSEIVTNVAAGINESDVVDAREDLLYSFYLEKNYESILPLSASMISSAQIGDLSWLNGKVFRGLALIKSASPNTPQAIEIFDEVLARGFRNKPDHDHFIILAVKWRISLYREARQKEKVIELITWVHDSNCSGSYKAGFLKEYGSIAGYSQN